LENIEPVKLITYTISPAGLRKTDRGAEPLQQIISNQTGRAGKNRDPLREEQENIHQALASKAMSIH
jgi:hypothetical protein